MATVKYYNSSTSQWEPILYGIQGDTGETGATGATNSLSIGTVTNGLTAAASITGSAPSQTLNLVLPLNANAIDANSIQSLTNKTLVSPTFTGTPTAPLATTGTNTTQVATTSFVQQELNILTAGAPAALNTLDELAAALGDDANYAASITTALGTKANLVSPTLTTPVLGSATGTSLGLTVSSGTTVPLTIQNNGTGNSFVVNDVASDTTPFIIDADGSVGIGVNPGYKLDVSGVGRFKSGTEWPLIVQNSSATSTNRNNIIFQRDNNGAAVTANFTLGGIGFAGYDGTNYGLGWNGGIEVNAYAAETWTSSARGAYLTITTTPIGSISPQERMRIDSAGNVGIGITPTVKFDVYTAGTNPTIMRTRNDSVSVYLDANNGYSYLNTSTNHPMLFGTNNVERMRIDSAGNTTINAIADATTTTAARGAGYMGVPPSAAATTGAYTIVAADAGEHIYSTATRTVTIPANGSVAFPVGTAITFIAATGTTVTIAITTDTLLLAGAGTTGSRTLAPFGMATAIKITSTSWIISGNGLT